HVGGTSIGRIVPKFRGDLLEATVVARKILDGEVESTRVPDSALDVLAQQIVAMVAGDPWPVADLERVIRRAASYRELSRAARVGGLDEEMVAESRKGETFILGATTWRIEDITRDRVIVTPAPGEPGKMPFWRGEGPGRPVELGQALGAFCRDLDARLAGDPAS